MLHLFKSVEHEKRLPPTIYFIPHGFPFFSTISYAQVFSDYDGHVDFSLYKTFAWIAPGDSILNRQRPDKLFGGFIMQTANQELKSKGLAVDTVQPAAIFIFHTKVQEKTKYTQSPTLSVGVGVAGPGY